MNQYSDYASMQELMEIFGEMPKEFYAVFLGVLVIVAVFVLAVAVTVYLFSAIGLSKMGKNRGMTKNFLAFIPVANSWYIGALADHINAANGKRTNYRVTLLICMIIAEVMGLSYYIASYWQAFNMSTSSITSSIGALSLLSIGYSVISIVYTVFFSIVLYIIFKEYSPRYAVLFLVLSIVFSFLAPIFIFAIRNKVGTSQQPKVYYQQPPVYPNQY